MLDNDCLFCKIIAKQILAQIVYEDDHALAFLDIHPHAPGHTMVIPKTHAPNLLELPPEEIGPLFVAVQHVGEMLSKAFAPDGMDGITMGANQGRASGQEVDHLHVHLLPRWHNDGGHAVQSVVNNPPKESLDEILRRLLITANEV
jgi:histidine triad (HIT) family protein